MRRALLLCLCACSSNSSTTTALFEVNAPADDFYALPFPNDLHRHADGTLDLSAFPTNSLLVDTYRMAAETLDGFSLNGAMSSRFSAPIDPASLPDPAASMLPGASVYIVNVDANSPNLGLRTAIIADFRTDKTQTIGENRLVVRPYPGFGLDEGTTYALVITKRVLDTSGAAVGRSNDFAALIGNSGDMHARTVYAPLLAWLDTPGDDERADVISAAVFTTEHATFVAPALRKAIFATPAPVATTVVNTSTQPLYTLWTAAYTAPNFQTGDPPYLNGGGEIVIGADGAAVVQRAAEPMRMALTVPLTPKPTGGWPICIYQHGTGGDYESFVDDGTAARLAEQGIAVISTDQVLHGPRDPEGADPGVAFFDIQNPLAARDNALQGAADAWSQLRLALGLAFDDGHGGTVTVDPTHVLFFGHSQGGLTGPPFVAFEPLVRGAVLSGTGGLLYISMLYKTQPIDFPPLVETLARDAPMDEDNPSLVLVQMWIERADGANYARFMVREPQLAPDGVTRLAPRNIFQTEGFIDTYAPNPAIEAFATAIGGDIVMTAAAKPIEGLTLRGRAITAPPVTENLNQATAVLAQYNQAPNDDGHFVVFDIAAAQKQSSDFLGTLAYTGQATVVSP